MLANLAKWSTYALEVVTSGYLVTASQIAAFQGTTWGPHQGSMWSPSSLRDHINPLSGPHVVPEFSQSNSGGDRVTTWDHFHLYKLGEIMFAIER